MDAPASPGVYFLLGQERDLRYIGKATNLRRRLADHARAGRLDDVADVRWETCATEEEAVLREADLIVFLGPSRNRSHAEQDRDVFVTVPPCAGRYGTFPHLAKGAHSQPAKRSKAGYAALLRLVADGEPDVAALHDLLSGRSARFLDCGHPEVDPVRRLARERDVLAARDFFAIGPRRLRALRLRHRLPPGAVAGSVVSDCLAAEVREVIGEFSVPPADDTARLVGRRRARSIRLRR